MAISVGAAAFSGFKLIGQKPLTVLVWGLTYLVLLGIPSALLFAWIGPEYVQFMRSMMSHAGSPDASGGGFAAMMPMMQKMNGVSTLISILSLAVRAVLTAAVLRAVLEPEKKGFFYMRLGMQEVLQGLLSIALAFLIVFILIGVIIVAGILFAVAGFLPDTAAIIVRVIVCIVAFCAAIWIALRFALAAPMTFAQKSFRLFESWTLTRGHVGGLFAVVFILILMVWALELVVGGTLFGIVMANRDSFKAMIERPPADLWASVGPWFVAAAAVGSVLTGAMLAIFIAPFATVYKQLVGPSGTEPAAAF